MSAYYLAKWLARRGHDVGVLTVAENQKEELHGEIVDGLRTWRLCWPRNHTQHTHFSKTLPEKTLWHIQDHIDSRNRAIVGRVLAEFEPDAILAHLLQGIGYNSIAPLTQNANKPLFYFLPDLSLACFQTSMFKNEKNCLTQCALCRLSSKYKMRLLKKGANITLISPSRANLETLEKIVDIAGFPRYLVPNLDNQEPVARLEPPHRSAPRLIYLGRLAKTKGVQFILRILSELASEGLEFRMTVVGSGPSEPELRDEFGHERWLNFAGKVAPSDVRFYLSESDLLLLPSLWREVYGNVVRQALRAGVPSLVTDLGGPKEIIRDGISGLVIRSGDRAAWARALRELILNQQKLKELQAGARKHGVEYSEDILGSKIEELIMSRSTAACTTL